MSEKQENDLIWEEIPESELSEMNEIGMLEEEAEAEEDSGRHTKKDKALKDAPRKKPVITYAAVKGEKGIRMKYKDGVLQNYEVTITYPRIEVFDEQAGIHRKKQVQKRHTCYSLEEAILYRNANQNERVEAKQKKIEYKKHGAKLIQAAEAYYSEMEKLVERGKKAESYLNQLRIQTDHFRRFFTGERTTYVQTIDTKQIEEYFQFEEDRGISRASIEKYKSHLKAIWDFMLKDKATYGVKENVVVPAKITTPESKYKAVALNYKQINELILEACCLEDPTFLYLVVFSMTQGLRRGELCGLMWQDVNFENRRVKICHNRVQLVTSDTTKLPKREKIREIELHRAGYDTLLLYRGWQERILGRPVKPEEFVLQWEINLVQDYVCHTGKVSRRWKEIYGQINKQRRKQEEEKLPYGRIHDGRHTYITLLLQGVKREDGSIVPPASYFQVFQSAGHSLPKSMQNVSTTIYNEDIGDRWDITRFWNDVLTVDIGQEWKEAQERHREEYEKLTPFERDLRRSQKEARMEKARQERLRSKPPVDVLQEYE